MTTPSENRFTELYVAHYADVLGYLLRRTSRDDAVDVAAEVFVVVWRRVTDVPAGDRALPWPYTVAARSLANQRRGNRRRGNLSKRLQGLAVSRVAGPDTEVIQRESDEAVIAALNTLAPGDREILLLNAWEGMPSSRLAERFAISPKAAEKRLTRAHGRLAAAPF